LGSISKIAWRFRFDREKRMAYSPLKVALVGIGWWSTPVGDAAKRSAKIDLAACYTRNLEKRAAFAKAHGCAEAESYEAILADPAIEGVLLTTPNKVHAEQIAAALGASKHVWVEKPMTNVLAEAGDVLGAWKKSGKVLAVGHCYRRAAGHRVMKRMIDEGAVGRPLWAEAVFSNPAGLTFTGSYDVGFHHVYRTFAARYPKPCITEMGGKNPAIVMESADLARAVFTTFSQSFFGLEFFRVWISQMSPDFSL